ncbi:uncharacterized protein LOC122503596 [Leptopilina heterotoma]|uniref:uncharacterized protein LOC122503596 n=1 Tax=Leptopilina heterotoma TaxID=63436 RepID=UPI001CAA3F90|nr:uncharacterized protein LOC122503596 [Leptopilina heterotoma]
MYWEKRVHCQTSLISLMCWEKWSRCQTRLASWICSATKQQERMDSQISKKVPHVSRPETGNLTIGPKTDAQVRADCGGAQFLAVPRVIVERLDPQNIVERGCSYIALSTQK